MKLQLVVSLALIAVARAMEFDCNRMTPVDLDATHSFTEEPYGITVGEPGTSQTSSIQAGEQVDVAIRSLDGEEEFATFIMMAHYIGQGPRGSPVGTWTASDHAAFVLQCESKQDYVHHRGNNDKTLVTATWTAPAVAISRSVEFVATVANSTGFYWTGIHSPSMDLIASPDATAAPETDEDVVPVEADDEDFHDELRESQLAANMAQHQQELIDDEIQYSEGNWQIQEEQLRRAHEEMVRWEQQEFEEKEEREERERQERIRMEILDQEQHEASMHAEEEEIGESDILNEENIVDMLCQFESCGASSVFISMALLFVAIVARFL